MTTRQLKDTNWASARKSIMAKYDKNGDGKFDQGEVEGIIDDYMGTIYNKQSLEDSNKKLRQIIIFGTTMIVLLSLSNLGTGIAAAYISKDITVIDDRLVGMDGDESALKTANSVKSFELNEVKKFSASRRLQDVTDETTVACIDKQMSEAIGETMRDSGSVNLELIQKAMAGALTKNPNLLTAVISLSGMMIYSEDGSLTFPASNIRFDAKDSICAKDSKYGVVLTPTSNDCIQPII